MHLLPEMRAHVYLSNVFIYTIFMYISLKWVHPYCSITLHLLPEMCTHVCLSQMCSSILFSCIFLSLFIYIISMYISHIFMYISLKCVDLYLRNFMCSSIFAQLYKNTQHCTNLQI